MRNRKDTRAMLDALKDKYGQVEAFLTHKNSFELLVAVILSAQTTDIMVNKVTPELFAYYPDAKSLKNAPLEHVEKLLSRINYFRTKAKHIITTARLIDEQFNGQIPQTIAELIQLAGVGRKVANVIMGEIFKIPEGIVVDTHVKRVAARVGWTQSQNPVIIEKDLMKVFPLDYFITSPKYLILIGRNYCFPKKPDCPNCPLHTWCQTGNVFMKEYAKSAKRI
jgi:endonuclease III